MIDSTPAKSTWKSNKLFEGLDNNQLGLIESQLHEISFEEDEVMMEEGEEGSFVFLMTEGSAYVYNDRLRLSDIQPGELVGLMALIDKQPRSASVIAGKGGARGFAINAQNWDRLMQNGHEDIKSTILTNYLKYQQAAFRKTNQLGLREANARLSLERHRVMSAHFFAQMVLGLIIFIFLLGFLTDKAKEVESTFISFGLLFAYSVWSFLYIRHSHFPMEAFGITMKNFKPAIKLALGWTSGFVIVLFLLKWVMITFWPTLFGEGIIDFDLVEENGWLYAGIIITVYSLHAILQEFIARSCIQGGLMQFIVGKWSEWKSIVLATLMFSSFHIMLNLKYGFLTMIPGFIWGYLFYKQRNLLAVSISHIIIGIVALFVLNLLG